jgi:hypothetical protein
MQCNDGGLQTAAMQKGQVVNFSSWLILSCLEKGEFSPFSPQMPIAKHVTF